MRSTIFGTGGFANNIPPFFETAAGEAVRSMERLGAAAKVNNERSHPNDERHEKHY
jgi:hypothetical protein